MYAQLYYPPPIDITRYFRLEFSSDLEKMALTIICCLSNFRFLLRMAGKDLTFEEDVANCDCLF